MTDSVPMFEAFSGWMAGRHGWRPDPALTVANLDVVQGLFATIAAFSEQGDGVVAQPPVYPPFLRAVADTGRRLGENPLVDDGARFAVDVDGLERVGAQASMILICNPHNPAGRVLERTELEAIAATATAHDLTIVSDEIHADLLYPGAKHIPMESVAAERPLTLTSATKGFNIAGLRTSIAPFRTAALKEEVARRVPERLLGAPGRAGVAATIDAWCDGDALLDEVLGYLDRIRSVFADLSHAAK